MFKWKIDVEIALPIRGRSFHALQNNFYEVWRHSSDILKKLYLKQYNCD